ncbi:hypothetical protein QFZ71_001925 [Streptomyces sp. V2I9]|nr:hypothetical protein [Streptomyces sp. V2I9]
MRRERFRGASGASADGEAVSGNHLPNPIPPRVRRHSSTAQTPAKACAALEGACTSLSGMAMPVVSYTCLGAVEHGRPSCFSRAPEEACRTRRRGPHPVSVGHAPAVPSPGRVEVRATRRGAPPARTRRRPPKGPTARSAGPSPAGRPSRRGPSGSRVPQRIGRCVQPRTTAVHRASRRPAAAALRAPDAPGFTTARERTGAVFSGWLCARRDRIQHTQPTISSQLHPGVLPFTGWPDIPPPTRQERTARYAFTRRGRATFAKGTSLRPSRMERFVIERFTPRFLIDIELVGEGVTAGPRDAVDFDLENRGLGTRATPRGNVLERQARKDQGDANTEGGLAS